MYVSVCVSVCVSAVRICICIRECVPLSLCVYICVCVTPSLCVSSSVCVCDSTWRKGPHEVHTAGLMPGREGGRGDRKEG
jgi:hypothetical protein